MFQLSVIDHLRLSFGSAIAAFEGHTEAASRLSAVSWYAKLTTLGLVSLAAILGVIAIQRGGTFQIAAAAAMLAALIGVAAYIVFDPEPRIYGHRAAAARYWLVCEKHRALLAEAHDKLLDAAALMQRRDALLNEVAEILERGPAADRETYRIARNALAGSRHEGYSDADLDRYLPPSLRSAAGVSA